MTEFISKERIAIESAVLARLRQGQRNLPDGGGWHKQGQLGITINNDPAWDAFCLCVEDNDLRPEHFLHKPHLLLASLVLPPDPLRGQLPDELLIDAGVPRSELARLRKTAFSDDFLESYIASLVTENAFSQLNSGESNATTPSP